MNFVVEKETCIGCGVCITTCPAVFEWTAGGDKAQVVNPEVSEGDQVLAKKAADACPVDAIKTIS